MKIIAAFYWKCNKDKSYLSYMLLDKKSLKPIHPRQVVRFGKDDDDTFQAKVRKAIASFFTAIDEKTHNDDFKVRYHIISHANSVHMNDADKRSLFVNQVFSDFLNKKGTKLKSQQFKFELKNKDNLQGFKNALAYVLGGEKCDEATHKIWAVALEASPKKVPGVIKKLEKFKPIAGEMRETQKHVSVKRKRA